MNASSRRPRISIAGVPLRARRSRMVVAAVLFGISASTIAPVADGDAVPLYGVAAGVAVGVVVSLLLHELAHLVVTRAIGDSLLAITPGLFGALSDRAYDAPSPRSEACVAAAGPTASLLLALAFGASWQLTSDLDDLVAGGLGIVASINLAIAVANLMPGYPLDGGRLFRAFVWYLTDDIVTGTKLAFAYGQVIAFMMIVAGFVLLSAGGSASIWGAWVLLATWAVNDAGRDGYSRVIMRETSRSLTVEAAGLATSRRVDASRTVDEALDDLLEWSREGPVLVADHDEVIGVVDLTRVRTVSRSRWTERTLHDIATPVAGLPRIPHDAPLLDLMALFDANPDALVLVETGGRITAAVNRDIVFSRVRSRLHSDEIRRIRRDG